MKEGDPRPSQRNLALAYDKIESILEWTDDFYRRILSWCLDHRLITLAAGAATFVLSIILLRYVPVAFFPKEDKAQFSISYTLFSMLKALGLAILLVFMILCAQYERYFAPMVIMAALPLSLTGAFGALLLTGQVMSVFTMIGIILLMGIVTKNGILLIDFTMQRIREGKSVKAALLEAGPIRLRPILMTTFAAGGGMLPIALGHGIGGEARSPMGVAVIGGLLVSTVLTLVVVPCFFTIMEDLRAFSGRIFHRSKKDA